MEIIRLLEKFIERKIETAHSGTCYFEGNTVYSQNHAIGKIIGKNIFIINYSSNDTTAYHITNLKKISKHLNQVFCKYPETPSSPLNFINYIDDLIQIVNDWKKARDSDIHIKKAKKLEEMFNNLLFTSEEIYHNDMRSFFADFNEIYRCLLNLENIQKLEEKIESK